jgi:starch phosphorylase
MEAEALYELLERDIIPTFYDRGVDGLPRRWIAAMKASMSSLSPVYNTHRMVREYTQRFYLPMVEQTGHLTAEQMTRARTLAAWRKRVEAAWRRVWRD